MQTAQKTTIEDYNLKLFIQFHTRILDQNRTKQAHRRLRTSAIIITEWSLDLLSMAQQVDSSSVIFLPF